jgi:hypothetical protein
MNNHGKILVAAALLLITTSAMLAQNASDYLSTKTGSSWRYQRFTVDAAQNPIAGTKTIETDSLAGSKLMGGITALVFRNMTNRLRDSVLVNVHGDSVSYFNGGYPLECIKPIADSLGLFPVPTINGWYTYIKLKTPPLVNKPDTLYRRDSTLTYDGVEYDFSLIITRTRKPDTTLIVPAGTFTAVTPFEINLTINWWILTPLGRIAQPYLKLNNALYIANNRWMIKETQASTWFPYIATDNSAIPKFTIPGYVRLLEKITIPGIPETGNLPDMHGTPELPTRFQLLQNYPNPFNGMTTIEFDLEKQTAVTVRVVDLLGRNVETLTSGLMPAGRRLVRWNSGASPSGVYFYHVETETSRAVKRMVLQK